MHTSFPGSTTSRSAALLLLLFLGSACSHKASPAGGGGSPTSPTTGTPPAIPGTARLIAADVGNFKHTVTIGWDAVEGATEYTLSMTRTPVGMAPIALQERTTLTTFVLVDPGAYSVTVVAKNDTGSTSGTASATFSVMDMQDGAEALFFNAGPLGETEGGDAAQPRYDRVLGWPAGSTIAVNVNNDVSASQYDAIIQVAQLFSPFYQVSVQRTARTDIGAFNQEIHVVKPTSEEQRKFLCPDFNGRAILGCPRTEVAGDGVTYVRSVLTIDSTDYIAAHEFAHIWGLHHIRVLRQPSGSPTLLMQSPSPADTRAFSAIELELIRTVYANGFRTGTPKADFIARGLIKAH